MSDARRLDAGRLDARRLDAGMIDAGMIYAGMIYARRTDAPVSVCRLEAAGAAPTVSVHVARPTSR